MAPLLHTDKQLPEPRPTHDVDGVLDAPTYAAPGDLQAELRAAGFKEEPFAGQLAHRWRSPDNDIVDLVPPLGFGGSQQIWDRIALESFEERVIEPGVRIRHVGAALFLAMKFAAYNDRGAADPLYSHDLQDIIALAACRPPLVEDVASSDKRVQEFVTSQALHLTDDGLFEDMLSAHLNNAHDRIVAMRLAATRLHAIAIL